MLRLTSAIAALTAAAALATAAPAAAQWEPLPSPVECATSAAVDPCLHYVDDVEKWAVCVVYYEFVGTWCPPLRQS